MKMPAKTGRPQKPYQASDGQIIAGLCRQPDGRWRITATGERFSEPDEFLAIQRFRQWEQQHARDETLMSVPLAEVMGTDVGAMTARAASGGLDKLISERQVVIRSPLVPGKGPQEGVVEFLVPDSVLWPWLRRLLIEHPDYVARMTGIPRLASLPTMDLPRASLKLSVLIDTYDIKNPSEARSKREALAVFKRMMNFIGATTLADLTTDALKRWRGDIEQTVGSAGTKTAYYGRIKTIISFGLKEGLDQDQINAALDRCKVLWTPDKIPQVDPHPISRKDFHKLLKVGGKNWEAILLCGLNFCMHLDEVLDLQWGELDLKKGTYASIRGKTEDRRIPRAATIWKETIKALKEVPRRGESPYVFTSSHGTRFNRNTKGNDFTDLRNAAELPEVTFDHLRDGAYTAACQANGVDDKWARLLAGHKSPGLQDNYVLRNPAIVKPACDAVHRAYFG